MAFDFVGMIERSFYNDCVNKTIRNAFHQEGMLFDVALSAQTQKDFAGKSAADGTGVSKDVIKMG